MLARLSACCASIAGILVLWAPTRPASAQIAPRILHEGLGCIVAGQHAAIEALVEPADDLVTVKVYFRAEIYPAFFYVEAVPSAERYRAVLPRPTRDVASVVYYLEAVDRAFNSFRTEEFRPRVVLDSADCEEDETRPAYVEGPADITVGATTSGATFPPGFLTEGIVGTISAAGRAAGGSTATVIGIGAAAGAAVGVGILVGSGSDADTTTIPAGGGVTSTIPVTTSIPLTTSVPPSTPVVACFDTAPNPPMIPVGETVRFDASCSEPRDQIASYDWDFNDGRDGREGRVVTRQYTSPGVFPAELTVTTQAGNQQRTSKEVRVEEAPAPPPGGGGAPGPPSTADIQVSMNGPLNVAVGATATYVIRLHNNGPLTANGISFNHSIAGAFTGYSGSVTGGFSSCTFTPPTVACSNGSMAPGAFFEITVSVTASGGALTSSASGSSASPPDTVSNNSASLVTVVALRTIPGDPTGLSTSFTSRLEVPPGDGGVRGQITLNEARIDGTDNTAPYRHEVAGRDGENVVEAALLPGSPAEGRWRFLFESSRYFQTGSFTVEAGEVLTRTPSEIVFRIAADGQRVRFRYRLAP